MFGSLRRSSQSQLFFFRLLCFFSRSDTAARTSLIGKKQALCELPLPPPGLLAVGLKIATACKSVANLLLVGSATWESPLWPELSAVALVRTTAWETPLRFSRSLACWVLSALADVLSVVDAFLGSLFVYFHLGRLLCRLSPCAGRR